MIVAPTPALGRDIFECGRAAISFRYLTDSITRAVLLALRLSPMPSLALTHCALFSKIISDLMDAQQTLKEKDIWYFPHTLSLYPTYLMHSSSIVLTPLDLSVAAVHGVFTPHVAVCCLHLTACGCVHICVLRCLLSSRWWDSWKEYVMYDRTPMSPPSSPSSMIRCCRCRRCFHLVCLSAGSGTVALPLTI